MSSKHSALSKSVDTNDPIPVIQKPRGYGGTAILYRNDWNIKTIKHLDGSHRVNVLELDTKPRICIINTYLPSRGNHTKDDFQATIDELSEIVEKFDQSHAIYLCGDLNSSLTREPENQHDTILRQFVADHKLHSSQKGIPTFIHANGQDKYEIDYILTNDNGLHTSEDVEIQLNQPINTSDHLSINTKIHIHHKTKTTNDDIPVQSKPRWDKCDKAAYKNITKEILNEKNLQKHKDIENMITDLNEALKKAEEISIPMKEKRKKKHNFKINNEAIKEAAKKSKQRWWEWRKSGSSRTPGNPKLQAMIAAKKLLRKAQRQAISKFKRDKLNNIMENAGDDKLFYKLVREQRSTNPTSTEFLTVNGKTADTSEQIINSWADYFESLASPLEDENFNNEYQDRIITEIKYIEDICRSSYDAPELTTCKEIQTAISTLNNNKAPDIFGLTAEHLKNGDEAIIEQLQQIINQIIINKKIPPMLKVGILTPVYKKGKADDPSNYRGISVTPITLKVLERILVNRQEELMLESQSPLQYGFTKGKSSTIAALLLSECILESKANKEALYLTTLDTQKAFDVVSHDLLLHKLYFDGIQNSEWLLMKNLYQDMTASIKWKGQFSRTFPLLQGVRQGGVLSSGHYKRYNNPLLLQLESNFDGMRIGTTKIQHVTCADDLALLSRSEHETNEMLTEVEQYSNDNRYRINPSKSAIIQYNTNKEIRNPLLHGKDIPKADQTVHLGILRHQNGRVNIQEKVNLGRKTVFSLLGAGCHSHNGVTQKIKGHYWTTFVVPRFTFGLETIPLLKQDESNIQKFEIKILKQIQRLPDRTSSTAVTALLGILPATTVIHKNLMNVVYSILSTPGTKEYDVAVRQLALKDLEASSMFSRARKLLLKYNLPTAYDILNNPMSTETWKEMLRKAVYTHTEEQWRNDLEKLQSLRYINPESLRVGKPHHIYSTVRPNVTDAQRAEVKARLLTGTYTLQANRARFNQFEVDPTCPLCIGSVRSSANKLLYTKDRTAAQRHRSDPARIDEEPGPWKNYTNFDAWRRRPRSNKPFDPQRVTKLLEEMSLETENDMPVDIPDPYVDKPRRCLLCQHNIELSYKNSQLLSQFVSPYTGRLYGRHVTGLCLHMQRQVAKEIVCARRFGFMPNLYKNPKYMKDPTLFNPFQKKTYPRGE